ncbi:MAG TPA: molybdopterin converting factor subunit 1 [Hyphomicrobiales bacterium]|nr:molybdopterin converting factor subunit 1 [Hyphomicrobiales bacterium]
MIDVLFFAGLRETLGDGTALAWRAGLTVRELVAALAQREGAKWQQALQDEQVMVAVNQEVRDADAVLDDGDEVAFFPPVTGG